jgi:NTP pyrophosphatase (non-canonical NTP hydrolase)
MINQLAKEIHENAKSKGFFDTEKNIGEMLCLIHSEVSEALEADRKGHFAKSTAFEARGEDRIDFIDFQMDFENLIKNSFEDELADIIIRVMDLAAFKGIDLEFHIRHKMAYNALREYKHGKKY